MRLYKLVIEICLYKLVKEICLYKLVQTSSQRTRKRRYVNVRSRQVFHSSQHGSCSETDHTLLVRR